jgi:hypothetical protein
VPVIREEEREVKEANPGKGKDGSQKADGSAEQERYPARPECIAWEGASVPAQVLIAGPVHEHAIEARVDESRVCNATTPHHVTVRS